VSAKAHTVPFLKFCIEAHFKKEGIRNIMDWPFNSTSKAPNEHRFYGK
jgi:hypothetical protein